jgi:D-galactarolactone cycloisomerase
LLSDDRVRVNGRVLTRSNGLGLAMKIDRVTIYLLEAKLERPFAYSRGWFDNRGAVLAEITTNDGMTGWGEAFGPPLMSYAALEMLRPLLISRDPLATGQIWHDLYSRFREHGQKGPLVDALSAIDIALWDIKGKNFGLPIHQLLGGALRRDVPAYASGLFMQPAGSAESYLAEEAQGYVEEGYQAVKMKVGFGVEHDTKAVRAVREAIGPDVQLMIDANEAYDALEAIRLARRIEEYDLTWFEEPVPPEDLGGYVELRERQNIPIAGGEAEFTRFGFKEIIARKAMDIIQPDICAAGGFTECLTIAAMANAFGIRCNPHVWGTAVANAASLHWIAVLPDTPWSLHPSQPLFECDRTEHPIREALFVDELRLKNGRVGVLDRPGLGIEIDIAAVQRFAVRTS